MSGLVDAKRLVVKIGSALLVGANGTINRSWLESVCADIAACRQRGQEVIVVTSGAVAVGRRQLALNDKTLRLEEKQAAAATGQIRLAHAYQESLAHHDITVAQLLLTIDDSENRRRYLNAPQYLGNIAAIGCGAGDQRK